METGSSGEVSLRAFLVVLQWLNEILYEYFNPLVLKFYRDHFNRYAAHISS